MTNAVNGNIQQSKGTLRSNLPGVYEEINYEKSVSKDGIVIFNFEDGTIVKYNQNKHQNKKMVMEATSLGPAISNADGLEIKLDNKKTEKWQSDDRSVSTCIELLNCDNCTVDALNNKHNSIFHKDCNNLKIIKDRGDKITDMHLFD